MQLGSIVVFGVVGLTFAFTSGARVVRQDPAVVWYTDLGAARERARETDRALLIVFR